MDRIKDIALNMPTPEPVVPDEPRPPRTVLIVLAVVLGGASLLFWAPSLLRAVLA